MILLVKDDSQDVWSVTLPCVGRREGFKDGVQRWQKKRIASMERLGSAVCDRSKFSHGCYRFFISYVCFIVEISVSIYMFFNLVT